MLFSTVIWTVQWRRYPRKRLCSLSRRIVYQIAPSFIDIDEYAMKSNWMFQSPSFVDAFLNISCLTLSDAFLHSQSVSYLFEAVGQCAVLSFSPLEERLLYLSNMDFRNTWSGRFSAEQRQLASALSRFAVPFLAYSQL